LPSDFGKLEEQGEDVASALSTLKNAVAVFEVPTNAVMEDPETGNIVPVNETITVELFLRRGFGQTRVPESNQDQQLPGVDIQGDQFIGYCVTPTTLDDRVRPGTVGLLDFAGEPQKEITVQDARFMYGSTGLLGKTLMDVLGHQIRLEASDYRGIDTAL
jgi:hypothetical protein